jgi:hypothetical protein
MRNSTLFYGAIAVAVIMVILCVYYIIPGVYHPLTFSGNPMSAHYKHVVGFGAIAVVAILVALINRPKAVVR